MQDMVTLKDSKLYNYLLTKEGDNPYLSSLVPDIRVQMITEQVMEENHPRDPSIVDATRIIVIYKSLQNKTQSFQIIDDERLNRSFPIDHFLSGYHNNIHQEQENLEEEGLLEKTIIAALNMSLLSVLGLDAEMSSRRLKSLSETIIKSLVSILTNDAKDVMILIDELPLKEGQIETESQIRSLWSLKHRETIEKEEVVTLQ